MLINRFSSAVKNFHLSMTVNRLTDGGVCLQICHNFMNDTICLSRIVDLFENFFPKTPI